MWRIMKKQLFRAINLNADGTLDLNATTVRKLRALTFNHFMDMFQPAWEHAFTVERNLRGWDKEGIIPFTRA